MKKRIFSLIIGLSFLLIVTPWSFGGDGDLVVLQGKIGIGPTYTPATKLSLTSGEIGIGQQNDWTNYLRIGMDSGYTQYLANNAYWTGSAYSYVNTAGYGGTASRLAQVSGTFRFDTASGGTNPIAWNNRMYITNAGLVGINTTTPADLLHLNRGNLIITQPSGVTDSAMLSLYQENVASNQGKWLFASRNAANLGIYNVSYGDVMTLMPNGTVGIGTGYTAGYKLYVVGSAYATGIWQPSDLTFKENITPIDSALSKVQQIETIAFNWNADGQKEKGFPDGRHYGVIAQNIQEVLPEVVKEGPEGEKAVAYTEIIPVLIEAIKEQQKEIDALKLELSAIKR